MGPRHSARAYIITTKTAHNPPSVRWGGEDCGELSTGEYHAQYERSSGWVWTGGLDARQGVATQDWGSPDTTLKQNSKPEFNPTPRSELGLNTLISERP